MYVLLPPLHIELSYAREVTSRMVKAGGQAELDRVNAHAKDDGNGLACCFCGKDRRRVDGGDHGHLATHQLGSQGRQLVIVSLGPSIFDRHIPAFVITGSTETATEFLHEMRCCAGRRGVHVTNHRHSRLLRAHRERPRCSRTAEQRDELAAVHSMTSSARASSVGGTVRPSALAVLRLITSSYWVGCWTGRLAGFSPLRIRSTYAAERRTM